jgi:uncharacterized protein YyaL (SSP411 family)
MSNRLASSTSPYLLQHADNPVDWWPWCPEAFAEARSRDVPVLLSVGYSACHWCHVMAHESFENAETAAYQNEHFVNIKVDREERPDVDAVYMEATQAMTGAGGWPMTCVLTPDGKPFFCGTYFPDRPRYGTPAFRQVLEALVAAWRDRRGEISSVAADVAAHLNQSAPPPTGGPPSGAALDAALSQLSAEFDHRHAGFGGAPKFPPSMVCEFLLRHAARTGSAEALRLVEPTLERMARGGIYDQLGGGFARYSVDAAWVVPHFEKMLYDNALLLRVYAHWWRLTGSALARRVVEETAEFLLRDLRTAEGAFASALDADSEGVEGKYYVWTPGQLAEVLGDADGAWAAEAFEVTSAGTFEHGASTLQLLGDPADQVRLSAVRTRLLGARALRVPPGRDDKVVAAWNGLAIAALAEAGGLLGDGALVTAAERAAQLLQELHTDEAGRLVRTSRGGVAGANPGVLEDYADVAEGYLALLAVTGNPAWLERAGTLLDVVLERFGDGHGGFFDTANDAEQLVRRPQDPTDNATPSGQSAAAGALLSYAALTGSGRHREAAERALAATAALAGRAPRYAGWGLAVAEAALSGPIEVAVVGAADDPARDALHRVALLGTAAGAVVVPGKPGTPGVPLLLDRGLVDGRAAAYVCRGLRCERPVTEPADLAGLVGARPAP